jgi:hypothetical protein
MELLMHRFSMLRSLSLWALSLAVPCVSRADITLFTNFAAGFGYQTGAGNLIGSDGDGNLYAEANSFLASSTANLSSLYLSLGCLGLCPDAVTVNVTRNSAGLPGAVLESFSATGLGAVGGPPVLLTSTLTPLLTAGTEYWVTVTADNNDLAVWGWNSTGDSSAAYLSQDGGTTWDTTSTATPGALQVNGVPEPSALILLLTVLLLLTVGIKAGKLSQLVRHP